MSIYIGRAPQEEYEQLMGLLNDVFFSEDKEQKRDFLSLLPKLYKKEYNPCHNNFIISYDEEIKGAAGLFMFDLMADGRKIKVAGIGNVACAADCRGKGNMTKCLEAALESAIEDGADISMLGGDRQRYGHFGYDPMGVNYRFHITERSMKISGIDMECTCEAKEITEADSGLLSAVIRAHESLPFYPVRDKEKLVDILRSWKCKPYAVEENGEFRGYFLMNTEGGIGEFLPVKAEDWYKLVLCAMREGGNSDFYISVPDFNPDLAREMNKACAGIHASHVESMCIFNYKRIIEAFLSLKSRYSRLADGNTVLLIHGKRCDEKLEISVKNNRVSVSESGKEPSLELEHREAQRLLGSMYSERRGELDPAVASWFPLPLYCYGADSV